MLKTLSPHGTVNRGVCTEDGKGNLTGIKERINISMKNGKILCDDEWEPKELSLDTSVSMNFWCFHPAVFGYTQKMFTEFLAENIHLPKSEFFIPIVADQFIKDGGVVKVIPTTSQWFGVTYKEDAPGVKQSLDKLIADGEYPERLW